MRNFSTGRVSFQHTSAHKGLEPLGHSCAVSHSCLQTEQLTFPQT